MLGLDKIYHANGVLRQIVHRTDLVPAPHLIPGGDVYLKAENLQVTGSFKIRGAYYKISTLTEKERSAGVIACSAGNHAQGVALAARESGIKSVICLPANAPVSKISATKAYGAEVLLISGVYDDAYSQALSLRDVYGYTLVHPFDDEDIIAGQGTVALEISEQLPDVDAVVAPIGGGGLISGIAIGLKSIRPSVKIYGVQAVGAPSMLRSLVNKHPLALERVATVADGIAVKKPGRITFDICSRYIDGILLVNDDEISAAVVYLLHKHGLVVEGAGATAVAAVMFDKLATEGKKTVCILSGGNIDKEIFAQLIKRGMRLYKTKENEK